ncbi:hypothetical protein I4U23_004469 [Adineta vaga]|nr:hypothetical protein I4U23_004469 [Adineta vaga]
MVLLTEITLYINIYGFFTILIIGTIGNILNLITLLSKDFRTKACIFYLISSSSLDLFFINFGIIIRLATEYFGNNLNVTNRGICKIRGYSLVCLPAMASTCLLLATFDRCVSTSPHAHWRRLSSMWFARRVFIMSMLFILISGMFQLIIFDLRNGTCAPLPGLETILVTVYGDVFAFLIPDGGTFIFGIMTWIHIHQSKNRVTTTTEVSHQTVRIQRMNRQLLILIFVQAIISAVIGMQRGITYSYNVITSSVKKSIEQQQIEYFILQISTLTFYTKFGMTFYINYSSSSMFRKVFKKSMESLMNRCFHRCKRD